MIKFFRRIRRKLIDEGNLKRYLIYAIGEILLVMIGILLALQVNLLNEERKLNQVELDQLSEIKNNLIQSKIELQRGIKYNTWTLKMHNRILRYIQNDLQYDITLDSAFFVFTSWASPYLSYTSYETLKSKGIDIIQNDSIKDKIIKVFENDFTDLVDDYDKSEWSLDHGVTDPFVAKNIRFYIDGNSSYAKPNDFEKLKKNDEFKNILSMIIQKRTSGVQRFEKSLQEVNKLIQMIEEELRKRKE